MLIGAKKEVFPGNSWLELSRISTKMKETAKIDFRNGEERGKTLLQ